MESDNFLLSLLPLAIIGLLTVPPYWRIWKKTGNSKWWGLLMFIPLINIGMAWFLAYKRWPAVDGIASDPETKV